MEEGCRRRSDVVSFPVPRRTFGSRAELHGRCFGWKKVGRRLEAVAIRQERAESSNEGREDNLQVRYLINALEGLPVGTETRRPGIRACCRDFRQMRFRGRQMVIVSPLVYAYVARRLRRPVQHQPGGYKSGGLCE